MKRFILNIGICVLLGLPGKIIFGIATHEDHSLILWMGVWLSIFWAGMVYQYALSKLNH